MSEKNHSGESPSKNSLKTLAQRLQHLGEDHRAGHGRDRSSIAQDQARHACLEAGKLGILIEASSTWEDFQQIDPDNSFLGSEHLVELAEPDHIVVKVIIPPMFGLTPFLAAHPVINQFIWSRRQPNGTLRHRIPRRHTGQYTRLTRRSI